MSPDPVPDPADIKQVLVVRRDLHMRRGKEIAQGAHASSAWLGGLVVSALDPATGTATVTLDPVARVWLSRRACAVT